MQTRKFTVFFILLMLMLTLFLQPSAYKEADKPSGVSGSISPLENGCGFIFRNHAELFAGSPAARNFFSMVLVLSVVVILAAFAYKQKLLRVDFSLNIAMLYNKTTNEREGDD